MSITVTIPATDVIAMTEIVATDPDVYGIDARAMLDDEGCDDHDDLYDALTDGPVCDVTYTLSAAIVPVMHELMTAVADNRPLVTTPYGPEEIDWSDAERAAARRFLAQLGDA